MRNDSSLRKLQFEQLESRQVMAAFSWENAVPGDWSDPTKWTAAIAGKVGVPSAGDDAKLTAAGAYSVTFDLAGNNARTSTLSVSNGQASLFLLHDYEQTDKNVGLRVAAGAELHLKSENKAPGAVRSTMTTEGTASILGDVSLEQNTFGTPNGQLTSQSPAWHILKNLHLGVPGAGAGASGGILRVKDGSEVSVDGNLSVDGIFSDLSVTGKNSLLTVDGKVDLNSGQGMVVQNQATFGAQKVNISEPTVGKGLRVDNAVASINKLTVGADTASGKVTVQNGGKLLTTTTDIRPDGLVAQGGSIGNVVVTGAGSGWINVGDLTIGNKNPAKGGGGVVQILQGATLFSGKIQVNKGSVLQGTKLNVPLLNNLGTIVVGEGIGKLELEGELRNKNAGNIEFEIQDSTNYDKVVVSSSTGSSGDAYLNGSATFIPLGYTPAKNDSFTLLSAEHIYGEFDNLHQGIQQNNADLPALGDGLVWYVDYKNIDGDSEPDIVQLSVVSAPGITVSPVSGLTTTESGGQAQFSVVLNSAPTADVKIGVSSSNSGEGTADKSKLTFTTANWNVPQIVTVTGVDDSIVDGNVSYSIVTAAAKSADKAYKGLDAADVSITNLDNDSTSPPGIVVSPTSGHVTTEAGGQTQFTVVLNSAPTADVVVPLSSSDPTEGSIDKTALTFTATNWNIPQTVTVTGVDDSDDDGDVSYTIATAPASSADAGYNGLDADDVSVTNTDDDVSTSAGVTLSKTTGLVTTEAGGTDSFTIVLNSIPTADVTINLSSNDTTEGTIDKSTLTFNASNWNVPQTITVTGQNDDLADGIVSYGIVTSATSSDSNYNGIDVGDVSVSNADNDSVGIVVSPTSGLVTTEAGGTAQFSIVLSSQPTADVTISIGSNDTTEGTTNKSSLTFTAANWNVAQTVTVTGVNDNVADGNVAYTIVTGSAVSSDSGYSGLDVADVNVANLDNDTVGIVVSPTSGLVTTEAGGTSQFTVVLSSAPTSDVTIPISSNDTTEGTVNKSSLTFNASNWNIPQVVTVTGVNDSVTDGNITYSIVTGAATSGDSAYNGLNAPDVSVTNQDDDVSTSTGSTMFFAAALQTGVSTDSDGDSTYSLVL